MTFKNKLRFLRSAGAPGYVLILHNFLIVSTCFYQKVQILMKPYFLIPAAFNALDSCSPSLLIDDFETCHLK
jgi:hypothetical protein